MGFAKTHEELVHLSKVPYQPALPSQAQSASS
jgi:hypothetical protein